MEPSTKTVVRQRDNSSREIVISALLFLTFCATLFFSVFYYVYSMPIGRLEHGEIISLGLGITGLVSVGVIIYLYIQRAGNRIPKPMTETQREIYLLSEEISKLRNDFSDIILDNKNRNDNNIEFDKSIREKIVYNLEHVLKDNFEEKYGLNATRLAQSKQIESQIRELQTGVSVQIDRLSRSGTVNLVIGVLTTLIAIGVLLNLLSNIKSTQFNDVKSLLFYLIPRTTLAIFIEAFSFFFLRLYKTNLEDVKYFHNEKTNIDSKIIALKMSLSLEKDDTIIETIKSFLSVERNFVLKKDETTIHTENTKMNNQQELDFLTRIADIIEKIKK